VREPGPLLASGRDADVFEYDPGTVLRRSREGRSLRFEAQVLAHLHAAGYPVPEVLEVSDDGLALVMERVDGPTMVDAAAKRPWTLRQHGRTLAELHERLHELRAPAFLPPAPVGSGDRVLHRDMHPLNVLMSSRGPVVIDWTGACAGAPDVDVAIAWVLMAAGQLGGGRAQRALQAVGRRVLVSAFLSCFDRSAIADALADVVPWKVRDPHMSESEVATMWALAGREEARR
jgi:aminoglycoside phosphotransferase (APT) family kinase protein